MTWRAGSVCAKAATTGRPVVNPLGKPTVLSTLSHHTEVVYGVPEMRLKLGDAQRQEHGVLP
jgi:hypothetical protein